MPHRLGRYAVRRRIGSGGFATVWLAYDEQLDSPVAIKVLADNWTEDHQIRQRFLEEGRYLRKVESPHVVSVYDAGELDDGRPYLVMSYADQGTLADRLEVEGLTVGAGDGGGPAGRRRPPGAARPRHPAPRRQARQRAVPHRRGRRRPHRPGDDRRPRAGQGSGHVLAAHHDRRHAVLHRARAGLGRGTRRPGRPVLPGRPGLPAAHRTAAVHPRLAVRRDAPWRAAVRSRRRSGRSRPRWTRSCAGGWPAAATTATRRHRVRDRAGRGARSGRRRAGDPALARPRPRAHPARPAAQPGARPPATCPSRGRRAAAAGSRRWPWWASLALVGRRGSRVRRPARPRPDRATVTDDTGTLSVTVPADWDRADATGGWEPPNADGGQFPALSVGTAEDWTEHATGPRVSSSGCCRARSCPSSCPSIPSAAPQAGP